MLVDRRFLRVMLVTFLFFVYVGLQVPLIPRLIEEQLHGNEFDIGISIAAFSAAAVGVRPWFGRVSDRYGLKVMMVAGALAASLAASLVPLVSDRWWLLPLRALAGAGEGAVFVGSATMVSDLAPPHRRAEATSYLSISVFGGIGVGPIIGEMVVSDDNFDRGFLVAAAFTVIAALFAMTLPDSRTVEHDDEPLAAGPPVVETRFHRAALRPGAVLAFGLGGFATFNAFVPQHAKDVGLNGSKWVFVVYSVVCLIIRIVGARLPDRWGLAKAGSIALTGMALGLLTIAAIDTPVGLFAGTVIVGIGMSFLYPPLSAFAVNSVPAIERTRVLSTFTMFFDIGSAMGGLVFGLVAELTSKRGGFVGGAVSALVGLWFLRAVLVPWQRGRLISASEGDVVAAH
jgi:MFS family permease